ncbi:MAG: hypothetical protein ACFE95_00525 [Candidatus Hodarchaeota archaeon]
MKKRLSDKISAEEDMVELSDLTDKVIQIKDQLKISNDIARSIKDQFDRTYIAAKNSVDLVGGSDDDLAKMWGYQFGGFVYDYLAVRDTVEGRQALSFIRMQLGHELNARIGSEMQYAGFVLGLSLRFVQGFENLKKNLIELEEAINKFEKHQFETPNDLKKSGTDLFGRKR